MVMLSPRWCGHYLANTLIIGHDHFLKIIEGHWTTLRDLELVTDREPEVWESMGLLCEGRAGRSPFEFLNLRRQ